MSSQINEVIIGIDPGARYMEIAAQLIRDNKSSQNTPINTVLLPNGEEMDHPDIKQVAVFLRDDKKDEWNISFGKQVTPVLRDNSQVQEESLEFVKLALHPKFNDFMEVAHVNKVLETAINHGRLQDFYSDLFEAVIKLVKEWYEKRFNNVDLNGVPVTMQICVPAMFEDQQRGVIRNAAIIGGAAKAELREEPLCSAVVSTHHLLESESIKVGQCLLIVDCGAGTLDISVTRLDRAVRALSGDHFGIVLTRIGICSGNEAGSHTLNHQLLTYITSGNCPEVPDIQKLSRDMGISEHEILRLASDDFDRIKNNFPGNVSYYGLNIYGAGKAKTQFHTIHLSHQLILSWYNVWIAKATPLLQKHGEHLDFARAMFSGGGMESSLLSDAMEQVLRDAESRSEYQFQVQYFESRIQCAKGALQYHTFQEDSLPSTMRFYAAFE